jgi:hypothetical protein
MEALLLSLCIFSSCKESKNVYHNFLVSRVDRYAFHLTENIRISTLLAKPKTQESRLLIYFLL